MTSTSMIRTVLGTLGLFLLAQAAQAADAACHYTSIGTFALVRNGQPHPLIDGSINGQPARFSLSTGSSATRIARSTAERLGLPLDQIRAHTNGIGGASTMYAVKVDDVAVGDIHSGKTRMTVLGNQNGGADGTLGADFLMQADVEFALAEHSVRFFRPSGCKETYLAYWAADAVELPFGGTYTRHANPRFMIEVNGVALEAAIGTGTTYTTISRNAAARAGIKVDGGSAVPAGTVRGVGDDAVATWQVEVDRIGIGSETIEHAHLTVLDTPPQGATRGFPDVSLGLDFLLHHRVLIANDQRKFYISYLGGEVFKTRKLAAVAP